MLNNDGTLNIEGRIAGISEIETITGLQSNNTDQPPVLLQILEVIALLSVVLGPLAAIAAITDSHRFNAWRQRRGHYVPALAYYKSARAYILSGQLSEALHALDRSFSWDESYVEKSQKESFFLTIQDDERYKRLIDKYTITTSESSEAQKTPTSGSQ